MSFVFTDIEGSTRLLRRLGDAYDDVLEGHRELLRKAWSNFNGVEVSTNGDSCFIAFAEASDAVAACAEAQLLLQHAAWPEGVEVRVRMGVHTGMASPRGRDYVALAVHQAARVMSAGHGGQVLVSDETAAHLRPLGELGLKSLGRFRLRDFDEPVLLHRLSSPDLEPVTRAVRALPADRHNLTRPSNAFVGRITEVADVASRLRPGRLLTLVGPGGVGKTRLAIEVGLGLTAAWSDGVWLVDMAQLTQPSLVPDVVIDALGVAGASESDQLESLLTSLEASNLLLILDNCEHLIGACADLVMSIRERCPSVGVVATSRTPLGITEEQVVRIGPLELPEQGDSIEEVRAAPAVQLLSDRSTSRGRTLEITKDTVDDVVALCERLDGLPLALELAAARLDVMTAGDLVTALHDRSGVLASNEKDRPERQRSLGRLLDWSYEALTEAEKAVLRRLSVFGSSFSLEAAVVAVGGELVDKEEAPELLWSLVDKSLVVSDLRANSTRYRLFETVRDYGSDRLADDEAESAALTLADWLLDELGPWSRRDREWLGKVATESDNIRALVEPVAKNHCERAQLLACTIGRFHDVAHSFRTGVDELTRWCRQLGEPTPARLVLLATLADLHLRLGETEAAAAVLKQVDEIQPEIGALPDWDDAAVERARGELAMRSGDIEAALRVADQALDGSLSIRGQSRMWNLAGIAAISAGDLDRSAHAFGEELTLCTELDDVVPIAAGHGNLAEVLMRRGDRAAAAHEQLLCLQLAREVGLPVMIAYSLITSARLGASLNVVAAAELHSSAEQILRETGAELYEDDRRQSDEMLSAARAQLGAERYKTAMQTGANRSVTDAIDLGMRVLEDVRDEVTSSLAGRGET